MASSDSGVLKTRCGPKRCCNPSVDPWMALWSSTSSPNRKTRSSRSISSSTASRRASTERSSRGPVPSITAAPDGLGVDMSMQLRGVREWTRFGERDCVCNFAFYIIVDRLLAHRFEPPTDFDYLVALQPGEQLIARAI